jgi:VanZ family protein
MIKAFLPALAWLVAIVFLSTKGGVSMPKFDLLQTDKLAHAAAYCLLTWLVLWGISRWRGQVHWRSGLAAVLFASVFGAGMEYIQFKFFPDRLFEYDDMLANTVGALLGWGMWRLGIGN